MAHFIKHTFRKKGQYIFRQFDKSDSLYGVIRRKAVIRLINHIYYTKIFMNEATQVIFHIDTMIFKFNILCMIVKKKVQKIIINIMIQIIKNKIMKTKKKKKNNYNLIIWIMNSQKNKEKK